MCGIAGYLNLNGHDLDVHRSHLPAMCASIFHRGPDEEGTMVLGPVALGMRRLSIIDLLSGQQPITNEDKTIWIVFNGEIYNFQELTKKLIDLGHKFATKCDTEAIVHLYEEYGVDCLQHLEGMFAFAIYDTNKKRLFIARDRMGEKPLHWCVFNNQFIFGSEIKAILAHPDAGRELNPQALQEYLALEYVPAPSTIFRNIHKLPAGSYLLVENGQVKIDSYWSPRITRSKISFHDACDKVIELLDRSIKLRLISDVPLGIFLSGGIDSSGLTALAAHHVNQPLKTFSIGFADRSFDESSWARQVAEHIGCQHHEAEFTPAVAVSSLEALLRVLDEPIADASILPTTFLSKITRQSVTVALSGEGGDELFGGYPTYIAHRLAHLWNTVPQPLRTKVLAPLIFSLPVSNNNLSFDFKLKRFIAGAEYPPAVRHFKWMGSIAPSEHDQLINPGIFNGTGSQLVGTHADLVDSLAKSRWLMKDLDKMSDVADLAMRLDISAFLADQLLVKADRASMSVSLECRLPFLAYPLVEFALSVPSDYKLRQFTTKHLLRQSFGRYLPPEITHRAKKGFGIPVAKWLKGEFKPLVDQFLEPRYIKRQGVLQWSYVERLIDEHNQQRFDRRKELWTLLMFQLWWDKFFNSPLDFSVKEPQMVREPNMVPNRLERIGTF